MKEEFKGIVVRKFHKRADVVCILMENAKEFEISIASDCLYENALEGDTIVKVANSNRCFIKRDTTLKCECYYFHSRDK